WDLCEMHGSRITAPKGWELVRYEGAFSSGTPDEDDLTALAEAVREAGLGDRSRPEADASRDDEQPRAAAVPSTPRTGRRGHLRVLPDPTSGPVRTRLIECPVAEDGGARVEIRSGNCGESCRVGVSGHQGVRRPWGRRRADRRRLRTRRRCIVRPSDP